MTRAEKYIEQLQDEIVLLKDKNEHLRQALIAAEQAINELQDIILDQRSKNNG